MKNEAGRVPDRGVVTGRIKFGTESNGGFRNITISNCTFEFCRDLLWKQLTEVFWKM